MHQRHAALQQVAGGAPLWYTGMSPFIQEYTAGRNSKRVEGLRPAPNIVAE
jgi:hypothetical protein